jgi:hypothetical protein
MKSSQKKSRSFLNSTLECIKEHAYHFSTPSAKNGYDNRFDNENSHFYFGIFYGNKMSTLPLSQNSPIPSTQYTIIITILKDKKNVVVPQKNRPTILFLSFSQKKI